MNDSKAETLQTGPGDAGNLAPGRTGSTGATQTSAGNQGSKLPLFTPTTETTNADGQTFAWDLIEAECRLNGIPAAAEKFGLPQARIRSRARDHKWKKIPDGRALAKRSQSNGSELTTMEGDLSGAIDRHRATVFKKTSDSIAKFRAKAPKNFREFDAADKIARRALGIDDDKPMQQSVLIKINEAIDEHEAVPIEATEIHPCNPAPLQPVQLESGNQGSSAPTEPARIVSPVAPPAESNAPKESNTPKGSLTLNPTDTPARRFVLP